VPVRSGARARLFWEAATLCPPAGSVKAGCPTVRSCTGLDAEPPSCPYLQTPDDRPSVIRSRVCSTRRRAVGSPWCARPRARPSPLFTRPVALRTGPQHRRSRISDSNTSGPCASHPRGSGRGSPSAEQPSDRPRPTPTGPPVFGSRAAPAVVAAHLALAHNGGKDTPVRTIHVAQRRGLVRLHERWIGTTSQDCGRRTSPSPAAATTSTRSTNSSSSSSTGSRPTRRRTSVR
jgi:hypothetical protein